MGLKSWADIKTAIRNEIWPFPTEAKTQIAVHDKYLLEGIMDLQKWVLCLQSKNTSQIPFCATYYHCGKTVVAAPFWGVIRRIYTIADGEWCDEVFYKSATFQAVQCFTREILYYVEPDQTGKTELEMGFKFADASADNDCAAGRAEEGLWAIYRNRLYVAPWIQSTEVLVVEWDGLKDNWVDTDMLDDTLWTPRVLKALREYLWWQHCIRFGDDQQEKRDAMGHYANSLADLIHDCREATQQQKDASCADDASSGASGMGGSVHVTNVTNTTVGNVNNVGPLPDPNGLVAGNVGDKYKVYLSGDADKEGQEYTCVVAGEAGTALWV